MKHPTSLLAFKNQKEPKEHNVVSFRSLQSQHFANSLYAMLVLQNVLADESDAQVYTPKDSRRQKNSPAAVAFHLNKHHNRPEKACDRQGRFLVPFGETPCPRCPSVVPFRSFLFPRTLATVRHTDHAVLWIFGTAFDSAPQEFVGATSVGGIYR